MTYQEAKDLLFEMTVTESLRKHAITVSVVMRALAEKFEEDKELWAVTGLLHDADYEAFPEQHPQIICEKLRTMGEDEVAHAIAGHYTIWEVPRISILDKAIVAADELTGFIVAASLVRPTGLEGMKAKSVRKKLKTKTFAAKVDRAEVQKGADLIGMELNELIVFIIEVLQEQEDFIQSELELA
ncbi:MAG: HD domain-containing protein [Saprospiraceae bacterium]|nr:HD domain-containing protein [Saprospiraceae bacterium]